MVVVKKRSLVAVDTNVLMDMAEGHEPTLDAIDACVRRPQLVLVVTPTVVQELSYGVEHWEPSERRDLAEKSLTSMLGWGIQPVNLIPAGHGICEELARVLIDRGFIPEEERHDALVLAEAALCDASMLVTWDEHLLSIPQPELSVLLDERDVEKVLIVSPARINHLFGSKA